MLLITSPLVLDTFLLKRCVNSVFKQLNFLVLFSLMLCASPSAWAINNCDAQVLSVSVAKDAGQQQRPELGWEVVTLPDTWNVRWPYYSGGAWYKIEWQQRCEPGQNRTVALGLEYISMAGAVYLNDELLWQDQHLQEPLSRSWNMPRYWVVPASALWPRSNTFWVYVKGVDMHAPGMGRVTLGAPEYVERVYNKQVWERRSLLLLSMVVTAVLGLVVFMMWVFYPKDTSLVWFAGLSLFWFAYGATTLMKETAPFANSVAHGMVNLISLMSVLACFCIYTWHFAKLKSKKVERILGAVTLFLAVLLWCMPHTYASVSAGVCFLIYVALFVCNALYFFYLAFTRKQTEITLLALCMLACIVGALHDVAVMASVLDNDLVSLYLSPINSLFLVATLAWRFSQNMRSMSRFNESLTRTVEQTRQDLKQVLDNQHAAEIEKTRLQERMQLAHDLHDGLGGSLVRAMVTVEQNESLNQQNFLSMLNLMRNDLRQVIDAGASSAVDAPPTPTDWLAPVRHRFIQVFDELDISCDWRTPDQWQTVPTTLQCLTLSRVLEEALTNVIKHSKASHVNMHVTFPAPHELMITVQDNGVGFDVSAVESAGISVGMRSMSTRLERVGGQMAFESDTAGTRLTVRMNLNTPRT